MKKTLLIFCVVFIWSLVGRAFEPQHVRAFIFDIDDNIFKNLPTKIILFKKKTFEKKTISTRDFAIQGSAIGKTGPLADYAVLHDPQHLSFLYFEDVPWSSKLKESDFERSENNYLIHDFDEAVSKGGLKSIEGPSFKAFQTALSEQNTARFTGIITARGHSKKTLQGFFHHLIERRVIAYAPNLDFVYAITSPEEHGDVAHVPLEKAKRLEKILDAIESIPLPSSGSQAFHELGFSDDDTKNTAEVISDLAAKIRAGSWRHVKISVFKTGRSEIRKVNFKADGTAQESSALFN